MIPDSSTIPARGFYHHYKHDPEGVPFNYTYEVVGVGRDTETKEFSVLYRPLYENTFLAPADYCVRPFEMFIETFEKDGAQVKRFTHITDPELIAQLEAIRDQMYPHS